MTPCPPDPLVPAVDKHMWELALFPWTPQLPFGPLSWFHGCILPLPGIPQKHSRWLIKTSDTNYARGIKTIEEPCILILAAYHVLMLAGPFWLWGLVVGISVCPDGRLGSAERCSAGDGSGYSGLALLVGAAAEDL